MKTMVIDVMIRGGAKFYCTLRYRYNPLFKVSLQDIEAFVFRKRPTLKYEKVKIIICNAYENLY